MLKTATPEPRPSHTASAPMLAPAGVSFPARSSPPYLHLPQNRQVLSGTSLFHTRKNHR